VPNGYHGSEEEWKRLEAPLRESDAPIEAFAKRHKMAIGLNYHDLPGRSLRWGRDPDRLIQIYLEDEGRLTWNLWLCASQDRGRQRFWKKHFLRHDVPMAEMSPVIEQFLDEALVTVSSWGLADLEFATMLSP
jgi:hypothetical protein